MTDKILAECRERAKSMPTKSGFRRKVVTLRDIESILASQSGHEPELQTEIDPTHNEIAKGMVGKWYAQHNIESIPQSYVALVLKNIFGWLDKESKETDHRPNCIPSVYGRTEDPKDCICHSWVQRTGDEPI